MPDDDGRARRLPTLRVLQIVWAALAVSPAILSGAVLVLSAQAPAGPAPLSLESAPVLAALLLACLGLPAAGVQLAGKLLERPRGEAALALHRATVMGSALAESGGVAGPVLLVLTHDPRALLALIPSAAGMLVLRPTQEKLDAVARRIEESRR